jgi:diaminopimelate epimerase
MEFTKMHGLGNDFGIVAGLVSVPEDASDLAVRFCDRHFGAGADGLVFILPSERADFRMRIFNADGSEAEQCGNAIRCVGKYVYDNGMTAKNQLTVETLAGIQRLRLAVSGGTVSQVEVDMGEPVLQGRDIPTTIDHERIIRYPLDVEGRSFAFTGVSMGNPHAVIFVDDVSAIDLHRFGPKIETHPLFPRKTNVEFVQVHSPEEVTMHVWERGCGETLACGTGACATGVAGALTGLTGRDVLVHLKGGDLRIRWSEEDNHVYMTGPATTVYRGQWMLDRG